MTVKRETLSKQMEAVTESHSARQEALNATATEINEKISKYAVIKQTKTTTEAAAAAATLAVVFLFHERISSLRIARRID